jgi:homoserine O-succinyltransferase
MTEFWTKKTSSTMPIILPPKLPAARILRREGVPVLYPAAGRADTEQVRVLLVNLMPDKPRTELQFARLLGLSEGTVHLTLAVPEKHRWRHADPAHLRRFYLSLHEARRREFDAVIVTGAPVETIPFEAVDYWPEITDLFDWADERHLHSMFVCWAAQAALYHRYVVPKRMLPRKRFGVFEHRLDSESDLTRGVGIRMPMPVSRHSETWPSDLPTNSGLRIAASSSQSGVGIVEDPAHRSVCLLNHPEYDAAVLADEYDRDRLYGADTAIPMNYFPDDDPLCQPHASWCDQGRRLYANWLDRAVEHRARTAPALPRRYETVPGFGGMLATSAYFNEARMGV